MCSWKRTLFSSFLNITCNQVATDLFSCCWEFVFSLSYSRNFLHQFITCFFTESLKRQFVCLILPNKLVFICCASFRDFGWQQRYTRFCGRIAVLSILSLLLYPFLWAWTIIGTLWFTRARDCVSSFFIFLNWKNCHLEAILIHEVMYLISCSYQNKVKNGVFLYGCFSATVDWLV